LCEQDFALLNDKCVGLDELPRRGASFLDRESFRIFCPAEFFDRTNFTFGLARKTNERAKIDQCGIINPGGTFWNKHSRTLPKRVPAGRAIDGRPKIEQARYDPRRVGFNNRDGLIEGKRRDGIRRIPPDAWQFAHAGDRVWKMAAVLIHDDSGGGVKISRSRIVAKSLPGM